MSLTSPRPPLSLSLSLSSYHQPLSHPHAPWRLSLSLSPLFKMPFALVYLYFVFFGRKAAALEQNADQAARLRRVPGTSLPFALRRPFCAVPRVSLLISIWIFRSS